MSWFADHFHDGGFIMFPTLVCGILMLGVAVRYAVAPEKRFVPLLTGLGVLTLASGSLGFATGLILTCGAASNERFDLNQGMRIAVTGFGESLNNLAFALLFITLAAVCGSYGAWRLSRVREAGNALTT